MVLTGMAYTRLQRQTGSLVSQVVLKPLYFVYTVIGGHAADKLNRYLLSDWINRLTMTQVAAAISGLGMSVVAVAAAPAIVKQRGSQ